MPSFADVHTLSAAVKRSYTSVLGYKLVKDTRPFPILIPHYLRVCTSHGLQSGAEKPEIKFAQFFTLLPQFVLVPEAVAVFVWLRVPELNRPKSTYETDEFTRILTR